MIIINYSQEALEEMANQIDLREYAANTVDYVKQNGDTKFAVCCFHSEKTASLAITPTIYHCFGCGSYGNIYTWIQKIEHTTFDQAVEKVAKLTHTDVSHYKESETMNFFKLLKKIKTDSNLETIVIERTILDINRDYKNKYKKEVPAEWVAEGIPKSTLNKYEIMTDPASNRIVYPVYDSNNNFIGVKGRTRFDNYKDLKIMKYMNYHKIGRLDYFQGMKQAKPFIKQKNEIIIFEGIKSVMKVDSWGIHNAVSAETSSLSEYQVELLIQMGIRDVIIAFDKDVELKKIKSCCTILSRFTNVWVIHDKWNLLDDKDSPCDKGQQVMQTLYERRMRL